MWFRGPQAPDHSYERIHSETDGEDRELGVELRLRLKSIRTSVHSTLRTGGDNAKVLYRRER